MLQRLAPDPRDVISAALRDDRLRVGRARPTLEWKRRLWGAVRFTGAADSRAADEERAVEASLTARLSSKAMVKYN